MEKRVKEYSRNMELENFLKEINSLLEESEKSLLDMELKEYPVVFVMGAMRTGSTLMMQWLAETGQFAYPTNMLSRFYGAPIVGAKIQRLLTDQKYNFRNEILDFCSETTYESSNGKTKGALEPNEFWYFWRRFLPEDVYLYSKEDLHDKVDFSTMRKELYGIANVYARPLALKGMICNYNIEFLNEIFPRCLFVCLQRDEEKHINSVLEARRRQYGTDKEWYSFKIPEYSRIIEISDVKEQVREQIKCINNAIIKGISQLPNEKKLVVQYEEFCQNPQLIYRQIQEKLGEQGYLIDKIYKGETSFEVR